MSLAQFDHWIRDLEAFGTKWGAKPAHNRIAKHLRMQHKKRLRAHVGPDGRPWKPLHSKPMPKTGDKAPMFVGGTPLSPQRPIRRWRVVDGKLKKRAVAFRKRFGPPAKRSVPALVRTRKYAGARKARSILDYLTSPGRSIRTTRTSLTYGYSRGTRWIEQLHFGGRSRRYKARIPARPIVGLNRADLDFIENAYADHFAKVAMKGK